MTRNELVGIIGEKYMTTNIENDEFSYPKAYKEAGLKFEPIKVKDRNIKFADRRFTDGNLTVIIETKADFHKDLNSNKAQLSAYINYEKELTGNNIIAILANTNDDEIMVWKDIVSDNTLVENDYKLKTFDEYIEYFTNKINDKEKVMRNTYALNELLNLHGIQERLRSQFVGTCLLTLKNSNANLLSPDMTTSMIRGEMKSVLSKLLNGDINKANKLVLLDKNVLDSQDIRELPDESFRKILRNINDKILPYINDKNTAGQDLLNLFFITFNKYVGKADKNQAFTPDHITDFMTDIIEVNRNSKVLDPCCGSGSFLVRAMTRAIDDCSTKKEKDNVKTYNIFGIEYDENVYGLATTNMLIHSDGNSNIYCGSCFEMEEDIKGWDIDKILMNPPYNGTRKTMPENFVKTWSSKQKQDPTKGMYFVKYIANIVKKGKLAVLLPMACAIGTSGEISKTKIALLREHTLEAVFSLPAEIFYPGATAQACCMIFTLGKRHDINKPTFFGYYKEDGFIKKKKLGRVERVDDNGIGAWKEIKNTWIELYRNKREVDGLSALQCVSGKDEWLAEAYMKTDYTKITQDDFQQTVNDYLAYLVKSGDVYETK